jgi:hypothetical protein
VKEPVIWAKVIARISCRSFPMEDSCIGHTYHKNNLGYGKMNIGGKSAYVHRVVMMCKLGRYLQPSEVVQHTCDNPRCVNGDHLVLGDHKSNMEDKVSKGRHVYEPARANRLFGEAEILQIRLALSKDGSCRGLAKAFGCSHVTISEISNNKTYTKWQINQKN